jgi:methylated-DNA-[protein]-cysteine S-methyltransferase
MPQVIVGTIGTPFGTFGATMTDVGLARLTFPEEPFADCQAWVRRWEPGAAVVSTGPALEHLAAELNAYLEGRLKVFTVPLDMRGTPFQRDVWKALLTIGHGQTCSYGDIARAIGRPKAVRAVGAANGANPVPVIVPCHRVIGSSGALTGYGGGVDLKRRLLVLEGLKEAAHARV